MKKEPYLRLMDLIQSTCCPSNASWIPISLLEGSERLSAEISTEIEEDFSLAQSITEKICGKNGIWFTVESNELSMQVTTPNIICITLYITSIEPSVFKEGLRKGQVDFGMILGTISWSNINSRNSISLAEVSTNLKTVRTSAEKIIEVLATISAVSRFKLTS